MGKYSVIGLMSGSSLDGLDICHVQLDWLNGGFQYEVLHAAGIEYDEAFRKKLKNIAKGSAFELAQLHTEIGRYFGEQTRDFIQKNNIEELDLVVSHGQTIFHQPGLGFTTQIGCGAQIAALTKCETICDLRTSDLAHGGQGAPIVPIAEKYLFPEYQQFLNLGGIANISFHQKEGQVIAFDVCACNTMLNHFARQKEKNFDEGGELACSGNCIPALLEELNNIAFCHQAPPKSLGTEHIIKDWLPMFRKYHQTTEDKLATAVEHIARMIGNELNSKFKIQNSKILITGGGALNTFLVERIRHYSPVEVVVPDKNTILYKEALAMALIGLLRYLEIPNILSSVTGASRNSIGGAIYFP